LAAGEALPCCSADRDSLLLGWLCERKLHFCFLNWHLDPVVLQTRPCRGPRRGCGCVDPVESVQQEFCFHRAASTSTPTRSAEEGPLTLLAWENAQYLHKENWKSAEEKLWSQASGRGWVCEPGSGEGGSGFHGAQQGPVLARLLCGSPGARLEVQGEAGASSRP